MHEPIDASALGLLDALRQGLPNAGSESRVSVSFNLMFSAFTEGLSKPLWDDE